MNFLILLNRGAFQKNSRIREEVKAASTPEKPSPQNKLPTT